MKPYVYIIQNKDRSHWYVGYKQKPKAGEDYWGSSDYLDELIAQTGKDQWTKTIIKEFDTWQEAKALKLDQGNISNCLNGKLKQHKGFTFRYANKQLLTNEEFYDRE